MIEEKIQRALDSYASGFNCAQSVVAAFSEAVNVDAQTLCKLSSCFGGGMRMGAACGAFSGALMVLGMRYGFGEYSEDGKAFIEEKTIDFIALWKAQVGFTDCRSILGIDVSDPAQRQAAKENHVFEQKCPNCIEAGVRILQQMMEES